MLLRMHLLFPLWKWHQHFCTEPYLPAIPGTHLPSASLGLTLIWALLSDAAVTMTFLCPHTMMGTEGPRCKLDPFLRDICCLGLSYWCEEKASYTGTASDWWIFIEDLLIVHIGRDEVATRSPRANKGDSGALGGLVKGSGAQGAFCSIPAAAGKSKGRNRKRQHINTLSRAWCHQQNVVSVQV